MPVSEMDMRTNSALSGRARYLYAAAGTVEFDGVGQEVQKRLFEPDAVSQDRRRRLILDVVDNFQTAIFGERGDQADRPAQQQGQGGKVTVGAFFQGGEAIAKFLADRKNPIQQPVPAGHEQPGDDQNHGGHRRCLGQILEAVFYA